LSNGTIFLNFQYSSLQNSSSDQPSMNSSTTQKIRMTVYNATATLSQGRLKSPNHHNIFYFDNRPALSQLLKNLPLFIFEDFQAVTTFPSTKTYFGLNFNTHRLIGYIDKTIKAVEEARNALETVMKKSVETVAKIDQINEKLEEKRMNFRTPQGLTLEARKKGYRQRI